MTTRPTSGATTLADARTAHATPRPSPGDLWRARWNEQAGVLLVLEITDDGIRVAPVSFDESPDETAMLAPASTNSLSLDIAIWTQDGGVVPPRVLDYKLGDLHAALTDLEFGTVNWGPTDPRTVTRARLLDLRDLLQDAEWAPSETVTIDLATALRGADARAIADILGSVPRAAALRRGQADLSVDEANRIADVIHVPADDLLAGTQPPLPVELIAAMDTPDVRSLVDQLAARRNADEVQTWRAAAYAVRALAAREHDRREVRWTARVRAYFDAQLPEQQGTDQ